MRNRVITGWTWLGIGIAAMSVATGCSAAAPLPDDTTGENVGGNDFQRTALSVKPIDRKCRSLETWSAVGRPLVAK